MITRLCAVGFLALIVAGCSAARMPVDESLAGGDNWTVEGRQGWKIHERLTFGPYAATDVDRSWTKGRDRVIDELEMNRRRQTFNFTLSTSGTPLWSVACEARVRRGEVNTPVVDIEFRNRSSLDCALSPLGDDREDWILALEERGERPLKGTLASSDGILQIDGTNKLKGGLPASLTTGYYIRRGERRLGAIEVVNNGAVRIAAGLSLAEREVVAAAAAALLLLEDLRGSIESV